MTAIILSVGDELVLGQTVDTNSAWISQQLAAVGCDIGAHITVGDNQRAIETAILEAVGRCDTLVISGGIGPTEDDLTRQALAAVAREPLEVNEIWVKELKRFFDKVGRAMPASNGIQAMIPRGATMLFNHAGTAAGIDLPYQSGDQKTNCRIFSMPGVPKEMKAMFTSDVLPWITKSSGGAAIVSRTIHTFALGESTVAEKLRTLMKRGRNPSVGTTVSGGVVSLRVNSRFGSVDRATREAEATVAACRKKLPENIYGENADTLISVVASLLKGSGKSVATAESCTGGLLAKMLTDLPGSSAYFTNGWVTYSNEAKTRELGVRTDVIETHGAVSEPVVAAMAEGALTRSGSAYALAISGVAGPGGGTDAKPVGTVCIALAAHRSSPPRPFVKEGDRTYYTPGQSPRAEVAARTFTFVGDREMIRDRSAKMALWMLRTQLLHASRFPV